MLYTIFIRFQEKCRIVVRYATKVLRSNSHIISTCYIILQKSRILVTNVGVHLRNYRLYRIMQEFIQEKDHLHVKHVVSILEFSHFQFQLHNVFLYY